MKMNTKFERIMAILRNTTLVFHVEYCDGVPTAIIIYDYEHKDSLSLEFYSDGEFNQISINDRVERSANSE